MTHINEVLLLELTTRRAAYIAAESRILESQEYKIGDGSGARSSRRADLKDVQTQIENLTNQINAMNRYVQANNTRRVRFIR